MVYDTTKTGLLPIEKPIGVRRRQIRKVQVPKLEFQQCIQPAPVVAKPFATLCNPFRKGCSIFCNHPTSNTDLKLAIKKSKLKKEDENDGFGVDEKALAERVGEVLEEMLSRYRQSPTADSSPGDDTPPPPRTVLVLDLRRTASQETCTTAGGRGTSGGFQSSIISPSQSSLSLPIGQNLNKVSTSPPLNENVSRVQETDPEVTTDGAADDDGDLQKRRGKVKKKKKKNVTNHLDEKSGREVIGLQEPGETQVSAFNELGDEISWHGSTSVTPQPTLEPIEHGIQRSKLVSDIFDEQTLKHLRRSLTLEQAEGKFRRVWRKVLKEALEASETLPEDELKPEVKAEVDVPPCEPENWIAYPRTFDYSFARFDVPIDKRVLNKITSLEYLKNYVAVPQQRTLLFNHVFEKHRVVGEDNQRFLEGKILVKLLGTIMGRDFTEEEVKRLNQLIEFDDETKIDLRTWIGLCSLCERVFGLQFSSGDYPNLGERPVLEQVDFDLLNKELPGLHPCPTLLELLNAVQNLPSPPERKEVETPEDPTPVDSEQEGKE